MKLIIFLFFILNLIITDDKKDIPKLDLRNSDGLNLNFNLDGLFKNIEAPSEQILSQAHIDLIKENAKNYIVEPIKDNDIVVLETNLGTIKLKLFPNIAPNHCLNFKRLSNSGFYDGTIFHRVIPGFMIQGGDLLTRDGDPKNDGTGNAGWTVDAEFNEYKHERGILSMARSQDPNSAGSQFFICVNNAFHLDRNYTVFGKVIENDYVLDLITNIPSESKQILSMGKNKIPTDENIENWLTYKINKKTLYFKIPSSQTKDSYKVYIDNKIKNKHRPSIPVSIKKIRVINSN